MPKSRKAPSENRAAPDVTLRESTETRSPVHVTRDAADSMCRAASECCHQHDRVARILANSTNDDELDSAQEACAQSTLSLIQLSKAYETTAAVVRPDGADEEWWHRANALWMSSREYVRRNNCGNAASREFKHHDRERLGALHAEYELEASSLLALRQAADAYRQSRPDAF
ncbi:MAG TPA: hypothetical protein VKH19_04240 [Gemmatimonadaceae bacterium]|nr:hypothetical protein [Gemmatimonadaceae bacterium]